MNLLNKIIVCVTLLGAPTAWAESYLNALGTGYQQQYIEMKKVAPRATQAQMREINASAFQRSNEIWRQESQSVLNKYMDLGKGFLGRISDKLKSSGMLQKIMASKGSEKPGAETASKSAVSPQGAVKPGAARNADSNTGVQEGQGTAKNVTFGNGAAPTPSVKPTVVDGIIQNR